MIPRSSCRDQGTNSTTSTSAQVFAARRHIHGNRQLVGTWFGEHPVLVGMSIGRQGIACSCTIENVSTNSCAQASRLKYCDISGALNIKERETDLTAGFSHDFFALRIHSEPRDSSYLGSGDHPYVLSHARGVAERLRRLDLGFLPQCEGH